MVGLLKFNITENIPFSVYLEILCITFKTEKSFITHPWIPGPGSSGPLLALSVFIGHDGQPLQHGEVRDTNLAWYGACDFTYTARTKASAPVEHSDMWQLLTMLACMSFSNTWQSLCVLYHRAHRHPLPHRANLKKVCLCPIQFNATQQLIGIQKIPACIEIYKCSCEHCWPIKPVNHIRPQLTSLCPNSSWTPTPLQNADGAPPYWGFQRYDYEYTNNQLFIQGSLACKKNRYSDGKNTLPQNIKVNWQNHHKSYIQSRLSENWGTDQFVNQTFNSALQ